MAEVTVGRATTTGLGGAPPVRPRRLARVAVLGAAAGALALVLTVTLGSGSALAASFLVSSTADAPDANIGDGICASTAGGCTLRAAIQEANASLVADEIVLPPGAYVLAVAGAAEDEGASGDLDIARPVTITGAGSATTTVDAAGLDRALDLLPTAGNVTVTGVTLRGGVTGEAGGAVRNASAGTVRLSDVAVRDSSAVEGGGGIVTGSELGAGRLELSGTVVAGNAAENEGGGILVTAGALTLSGTTVEGNSARGGGGLYNAGELSRSGVPSRVDVTTSQVTGNTATGSGGGLYNDGEGTLAVTGSTFTGNVAHGDGGAIMNGSKTALTITGGSFDGNLANGAGGAVSTSGERAARIEGVTFTGNEAGGTVLDETGAPVAGDGGGGALATAGGPVTVTGSTFTANTAVGEGGAILLESLGSVQITDSTVAGNASQSGGGGIENAANRVTLTRVGITGNRAGADGGGVQNNGSGAFTIEQTTIARNTAANGGGVANQADGAFRVVASTIWDNRALVVAGAEEAGLGGGVFGQGDADTTYENTTITGNYAQVRGGGLYIDADAGVRVAQVTISGNSAPVASGVGGEIGSVNLPVQPSTSVLFRNSIVAGNLLSPNCSFALGSQGGNLDDGDSCHFSGPRDRTGAGTAGLDAVADNGGPTLTMMPQFGTFAIDGGVSPCPATDQRGVARPQNELCDIGAVESEGPFLPFDDVPPDTEYVSGPVLDTEATSVFTFAGSDNQTAPDDLLYECRLLEFDPAEPPEPVDPTEPLPAEEQFVGCANPWQVPVIEDGTWRLEVRAIDRAGNTDPSPDVYDFTVAVDVTPPDTMLLETPPNPSGSVAAFTFEATDDLTPAQFLEFECRLDSNDPAAWLECSNPAVYANLTPGVHTFQVRATDLGDNIDPTPAGYTWLVGTPVNCDDANTTLLAAEDAFVDEGSILENFGVSESLVVRSAAPGQDARSLIRFTLPGGASCGIERAVLRLYGEGDAGRTLAATPLDGPWTEDQVTWQNQPGVTGSPATAASGSGYREWDVTAHVAAMLSGASPNHGWLIADTVEEDAAGAEQSFLSSEALREPPTPPQLVLRFNDAGIPPPPAPPAPGAAETVTCGQVLTASTRLANDLSCPGAGLVVGASDIVVDLNGFTVRSSLPVEPGEEDGLGAGIRNAGHDNVVIRGGTVENFGYGVRLLPGTTFNVVEDMVLRNNINAGVELFDADNGRDGNVVRDSELRLNGYGVSLTTGTEGAAVTGNTFVGNVGVAVHLYDAADNRIEDNTVSGLTGDPLLDSDGGVYAELSSRNVFRANTLSDTGDAAFVISDGSNDNLVEANTVSRASDSGISIADSDGNVVRDNRVYRSGGDAISIGGASGGSVVGNDVRFNPGGVALAGSSGVLVDTNDASGSGAGGISVEGGGNNIIVRNTAHDTNAAGISVEAETLDANGLPVDGNLVEDNQASRNGADGISVNGAGHTVTGNSAHDNLGFGIAAAEGTVDGGGNTASGNAEPLQCVGVVCQPGTPPAGTRDIEPPDTQILTTFPTPVGNLTTVEIAFTGTDNAAPPEALRFQCRLDAPPDELPPPEPTPPGEPVDHPTADNWTECASPETFRFLPAGPHTFEVRAVDPADLFDPTAASVTFEVAPGDPAADAVAPSTTLVTAPSDPTVETTAVFTFRGSDDATVGPLLTYECRLDGGSFAPCTSPASYPVGEGPHTFEVRAIDLAGNADPTPAAHSWSVVAAPPDVTAPDTVIDSTPDPTTVATNATFTFSATEPGATFACALDGAAFAPCTSPQSYTGLAVATHTFAVRAVDAAGNTDATPATFTWAVTDPPVDAEVTCGQVLTVSTRVQNDLLDCPTDGLVIGADAITIDLNGATIDGVGVGAGVRNDGFDSVTITNGFVQEFVDGVALNQGTARSIVSDLTVQLTEQAAVTLTNADQDGVGNIVRTSTFAGNGSGVLLVAGSQGNTVLDNVVAGSSGVGIHLVGVSGNRIEGNAISGSSDAGIALEGAVGNVLVANSSDGNSDAAFVVELGSHATVLRGNSVLESEAGINVEGSDGVQLLENVLNGSSDNGITLEESSGALIRGNDLRFNGAGLELSASSDNRIEGNDASEGGVGIEAGNESFRNEIVGNTANANDAGGIAVNGGAPAGAGNLVEGNTANDNTGGDGIYIGSVSHMVRGNIADGNGGWGIYAAEGSVAGVNVDGGFNRATGNVGGGLFDPVTQTSEQCFNIRCDGGPGLPVDQVAPDTVLVSGPAAVSEFTSATFAFEGSDNASAVTFECRLDSTDEAMFAPCTSPVGYSGLALGTHTFTVRAVDFVGNRDADPVVVTWEVVAPDPLTPPVTTIVSGPDARTVTTTATFTFTADEEGVTFACRLDGGASVPCTSPVEYTGLGVGTHAFEVRGTDPQGNVELAPPVFTWSVGPPPVAATVACGQTLTQSTLLLNDLIDCPNDGLVVGADGITVDLDGHTVDGIGQGTGVVVNGRADVTVTDGTITEFDAGVAVTAAGGALVDGIAFTGHQLGGVTLTDADGAIVRGGAFTANEVTVLLAAGTEGARITGNTLAGNPGPGVRIENSAGNRVDGNDITDGSGPGVELEGASSNVIVGNTLADNSGGGITLDLASQDNVVADNTVDGGAGGIEVSGSDGTQVVGNRVSGLGSTAIAIDLAVGGIVRGNDVRGNPGGIELSSASGILVENNNTGSSSGTGILIDGPSPGNTVRGNVSSTNSGEGIYVASDGAPGTLIEGNTANNNAGNGITVNTAGHTITGNSVNANDGWGILAVPGNIDGGGNTASGNSEPGQCSGVVCTIGPAPGAPDTILVERPPDPTDSRAALFTFTGTDDTTPVGNLGFECRLDTTAETGWVECENPAEYVVAPGPHVFEVRAVDANEQVDPTPARWEWTYSGPVPGAPDTFIDLAPAPDTPLYEALFTFSSNEPDVTFECSLDGAAYSPCAFAVEYSFEEFEVGPHTFRVRATDFEGNTDPTPAEYTWTIRGIVTTITDGPAYIAPEAPGEPAEGGETEDRTATFTFEANVADATFLCSLDLGPYVACTSPRTYTGLAVGEHVFAVVAEDAEGNQQLEPTEYGWTVVPGLDTTPPTAQLAAGTPMIAASGQPVFFFSGTDNQTAPDGLGFECALDTTGEFLPCVSGHTYPNPEQPEPLGAGTFTFSVQAIDLEGNIGAPVSVTFTYGGDTVAPITAITSGPSDPTAATASTFTFTANDPFPTFECALDAVTFEPCAAPFAVQGLEPGGHTLAVRAVDLSGNTGDPAVHSWTVVGAPVATILSGPAPVETVGTATFTFAADQAGSTFTCALDGGAFLPCASPHEVSGLQSGPHELQVLARNSLGVVAAEPAVHQWAVELPPAPVVSFTLQPPATTSSTDAALAFTSDQATTVFECALDNAAPTPCTSPVNLTGLALGEHDFAVRGTGPQGQIGPVAVAEWEILPPDVTAPDTTLAAAAPPSGTATTATVEFAATEAGSTFACSLNGDPFAACTSPLALSGLAPGPQELRVAATDAAGNTDPTPLVVTWTVTAPDTTAPDTTLVSGPPASTTDTGTTIAFAATEAGSTFECRLDTAGFAPCTSPVSYTGLAVATHTVEVRATDPAGNTDGTPLAVTWTVTAPAPSCPTTPVVANPAADSWVLQSSSGQNYGADSILKVDSKSGANSRALVRFTLPAIPAGCEVTGATLRLYASSSVTGRTLQARPLTGTWSETGVTWSNQPGAGSPIATTSSGSGYRQWTVTDAVRAQYTGPNHGFLVRDNTEGSSGRLQGFHSREESVNRPELVITFGPASGSSSPPPPSDTTAPDTTITSGPASTTTDTAASFAFTATEPGSTFQCSLDGAAFAPCTAPHALSGLSVAPHQFQVRATDAAGNTDATPATYAWTVAAPTSSSCTAGPATVGAVADAWFEEKDPGKNYGTDSVLKVRAKGGEAARALVRFTLPATPAGCQVVGAELRLRNASPVAGRTIQVLRATASWTEGGVTWASQPATTGTAATTTTGSNATTMTWNVTAQVQSMLTAGAAHGFLVRDANEAGGDAEQGFHGREKAPDAPPQLVLTYGPA